MFLITCKDSQYLLHTSVSQVPAQVVNTKLTTQPVEKKGRYMHGKLKTWKECIKTNFHGQDVSYDMFCKAAAILKIYSVCKQDKNHPQVYVEECKYTDVESQQCNILSDANENRIFKVLKRHKQVY